MSDSNHPISIEELNKLGNYLARRPWVEVRDLMELLESIAARQMPSLEDSSKQCP